MSPVRTGAQKHLGNLIIRGRDVEEPVDNSAGQNVQELKDRLNVDRYVSPHSDIVALMVLEHQVLVHNRIVKANFDTRQALDYNAMMNRTLENPEGTRLESTTRRIKSTGDRLVEALLMVDEAKLTEPIKGTSGFTEQFATAGPHDHPGTIVARSGSQHATLQISVQLSDLFRSLRRTSSRISRLRLAETVRHSDRR